jgi:hypothetical protein
MHRPLIAGTLIVGLGSYGPATLVSSAGVIAVSFVF